MPGAGGMGVPPPAAQQAPGQLAGGGQGQRQDGGRTMEVPRRTAVLRCARLFLRARRIEHRPAGLDSKNSRRCARRGGSATPDFKRLGRSSILPTSASRGHTDGPPAELHFSTFISAFMAVLTHGMENAPPACITTVATLRYALEAVEKSMRTYLQFHAPDIAPYFRTSPRTACPRHEPWSR